MDWVGFLLLSYCFAVFLLFFFNPRWSLLFFFSTKFTIDMFWDHSVIEGISVLRLTGVGFPLLCFIFFMRQQHTRLKNPLWKILMAIFVLNIIAGLWGYTNSRFLFFPLPHTPLSLAQILDWNFRFFNLAAAVMAVPLILNRSDDKIYIMRAFLAATVLPVLISCYQISNLSVDRIVSRLSEPYSVSLFERITATYHDAGTLSIVTFSAVVLSAALYFIESSRGLKTLYGLYCALSSVVLYFTFSRTMWISITFFLVFFFLIQNKYRPLSVVLIVAALVIMIVPTTQKRFEREMHVFGSSGQTTQQGELEKIGAGRLWLWNDAKKHFIKLDGISKIIGSGGSYGSHNQYIAWLLRNGIIGLAVWIFFLYNILILLWHESRGPEGRTPLFFFVFVLICTVVGVTNMASQPWDNITFVYFFWSIVGMQLPEIFRKRGMEETVCI